MKTACTALLVAALLGASWTLSQLAGENHAMAESKSAAPMIAHNVYFTLNDNSPANVQALVDACKKYLVDHPGVEFFACGTLSVLDRPVNDRAFDVGLHVVFTDRAAHDKYQTSADHLKFIDENRATWKQVRVFDSDVERMKARD